MAARRIHAQRERVLAAGEAPVAVVRVLAGLAEDRLVERELRHVAAGAADLGERCSARGSICCVCSRVSGGSSRPSSSSSSLRRRPRLRRRGTTASAVWSPIDHLVRDAVAVAVDAVADQLDRLHAELVVRGAAVEVAQEGHASPSTGTAGRRGPRRRPPPRACRPSEASPGAVRVTVSVPKDTPLATRSTVREPPCGRTPRSRRERRIACSSSVISSASALDDRRDEEVRRVALDEVVEVPAVPRIAVHVGDREARAVVAGLVVAGVARLRVRPVAREGTCVAHWPRATSGLRAERA